MRKTIEDVYLTNREYFFNPSTMDRAYYELIQVVMPMSIAIKARFLNNLVDSQEWFSDTQFIIYKCVDKYQNDMQSKFTTYLYTALANRARDIVRVKKRRLKYASTISYDELIENNFDQRDKDALNPEQHFEVVNQINNVKPPSTELQKDVWPTIFNNNIELEIQIIHKYGRYKVERTRARMIREIREQML